MEQGSYSEKWFVHPNFSLIKSSNLRWLEILQNCDKFEQFDEDLRKNYLSNRQDNEEFGRKNALKDEITEIITSFFCTEFHWRFKIFLTGSSISSLAAKGSDADMCIYIPDIREEFEDERSAALNVLQIVRHMIVLRMKERKSSKVKFMQLVIASVPVLKIETVDGLEADLSVCTSQFLSGAHNSHFIYYLSLIDDRFAPLCFFIKQWASLTKVKNPSPEHGQFNSYAVSMLVVHFLQCGVFPPVLPNVLKLTPAYFADGCDIPSQLVFNNQLYSSIPDLPKNTMSMCELFIRFLNYYLDYDFSNFCISIRQGESIHRGRMSQNKNYNKHFKSSVWIEDPMDNHNPGRTMKGVDFLKDVFRKTFNIFNRARDGLEENIPTLQELYQLLS